jgi:cytochrome oxidase Cu insertion factor (SCO1/SenC/PrrC family)
MKRRVLTVVVLMLGLFLAAQAQAQYVVGDSIADFTLNDASGVPVSLYDYDGKVIFLTFWTPT